MLFFTQLFIRFASRKKSKLNQRRGEGAHGYELSINTRREGHKLSMDFQLSLLFFTLLLLSILKVEVDMSYRSKQEWELVIEITYRCIFSCHHFSLLLFLLSFQTDKEMNVGHARTLHFY